MKFYNSFLALIASVLLLSCVDRVADSSGVYVKGTVKYVSLEGGFWAIYGDDNKNYDPINLPKEYQSEGKRIEFTFKERKDLSSFHMWGTIIEIIEINELK